MDFTTKAFSLSVDGALKAAGTLLSVPAKPALHLFGGISWMSSPGNGSIVDIDNVTAGD